MRISRKQFRGAQATAFRLATGFSFLLALVMLGVDTGAAAIAALLGVVFAVLAAGMSALAARASNDPST